MGIEERNTERLMLPAKTSGVEMVGAWALNSVNCVDALDLLYGLPKASADAIITDMPYGTTACSWDVIVPFDKWWAAVKHALKPRGVMVTTASQPFTSLLVCSNLKWFRYEWIWDRSIVSGFLDANRKPLKCHENILVFCIQAAPYIPVMGNGKPYSQTRELVPASVYGKHAKPPTINAGWRYPTTILRFPNQQRREHPTQKPVALYDYLIRTYTQPGDLVIDPFAGSGTTAVAARNLNRRYIAGDTSSEYCAIAERRLAQPYTINMFEQMAATP